MNHTACAHVVVGALLELEALPPPVPPPDAPPDAPDAPPDVPLVAPDAPPDAPPVTPPAALCVALCGGGVFDFGVGLTLLDSRSSSLHCVFRPRHATYGVHPVALE